MAWIGIDPGKKGAIVRIGRKVHSWAMPLTPDGDIDIKELCSIFDTFTSRDKIAVELIHSIYGTGKGSMFTMGRGLGNIEAALVCSGLSFTFVRPPDWQSRMWIDKDEVWIKQKGKKDKRDTKATSLNAARRLYPKMDFRYADNETPGRGKQRTSIHDGLVDALLIANYSKNYIK